MTDANSIVTAFTYDPLGHPTAVTTKHPANASLDGTTLFDYGAHVRVTGMTLPSTQKLFMNYDLAGRLIAMRSADGERRDYSYDIDGNVTAEIARRTDASGSGSADLAYAYDLADRITQITYPSGRLVRYSYDTKGRVSQVQTKASSSDPTWTVLASGYTYEPFGSVKTIALGNGLSVANDWGNDGVLASRRLYATSTGANLSSLAYGYDVNGNVGAVRDKLNDDNSIFYGYDANDRLTFASMVLTTRLRRSSAGSRYLFDISSRLLMQSRAYARWLACYPIGVPLCSCSKRSAATSALAESRTLSPSTSATRPRGM